MVDDVVEEFEECDVLKYDRIHCTFWKFLDTFFGVASLLRGITRCVVSEKPNAL